MGRGKKSTPVPEIPIEPPYDRTRFVNAKAEAFYEAYKGNSFMAEREFDWESFGMNEIFTFYKWKTLASNPEARGVSVLVKYFYANIYGRGDTSNSFVNGVEVSYKSKTINQYYHMPAGVTEENCAFQKLMKEMDTVEKVKRMLPRFSTTLGVNVDPQRYHKGSFLKTTELVPELQYLYRFICERIMPSSHKADVHWRRAALMHVILRREKINTGLIIRQEMQMLVQGMGSSGYKFPILVSELVEKAGHVHPSNIKDIMAGPKITLKKATNLRRGFHAAVGGSSQGGEEIEEETHSLNPYEATFYLAGQVEAQEEQIRESRRENQMDSYSNSLWQTRTDQRLDRIEEVLDKEVGENQYFRQRMMGKFFPDEPYPPPHDPYQYPPYMRPSNMQWSGPSWPQQAAQPPQWQGGGSSQWQSGGSRQWQGDSSSGDWDRFLPPPQ